MKVTLALVCSVNGHITDGVNSSIYRWTSAEDQEHFFHLIKQYPIIVMGRRTYTANRNVIKLEPNKLRIVLTNHPQKYTDVKVPHQLEFSNEDPKELIARLRQQKPSSTDVLVVGGNQISALFLEAGLIDQLLLTIEPAIFGKGLPMLSMFEGCIDLKLKEKKVLNERGTVLLNYQVIRNTKNSNS